jgi:hypothetical protein
VGRCGQYQQPTDEILTTGSDWSGCSCIMRRSLATRYGGPDVLTLALDAPIPKPRGNQLLIRVAASSVNPSAHATHLSIA